MSKTIDEKVVEMRFDNQQFEKNIATTMNSIKSLEKSCNMAPAVKEFENFAYKTGFHLSDVKEKMISLIEYNFANKLKNQIMSITSALTIDRKSVV